MATPIDTYFMQLALEQARVAYNLGEVPIGALVVRDALNATPQSAEQYVVSRACNRRESAADPAAHAEFLAIEDAARVLKRWRLSDCTVYVTLEPCLMCAGLMYQARIARCVFGAPDPKAGALGSLYEVHEDERLNHTFPVSGGVLEEECAVLLRSFFKERRK
jgi:tRNA(adenine34) deaminase